MCFRKVYILFNCLCKLHNTKTPSSRTTPLKLYASFEFRPRTASTVCIMNRYNINNTLQCAAFDVATLGIAFVAANTRCCSPVRLYFPKLTCRSYFLQSLTYSWLYTDGLPLRPTREPNSLFIIIKLLFGNLCTLWNYSANGKRRGSPRHMPQATMYSALSIGTADERTPCIS